jgi:hypothetical protein
MKFDHMEERAEQNDLKLSDSKSAHVSVLVERNRDSTEENWGHVRGEEPIRSTEYCESPGLKWMEGGICTAFTKEKTIRGKSCQLRPGFG